MSTCSLNSVAEPSLGDQTKLIELFAEASVCVEKEADDEAFADTFARLEEGLQASSEGYEETRS